MEDVLVWSIEGTSACIVDCWELELPRIRNMLSRGHHDLQLKWSLTKYLLV